MSLTENDESTPLQPLSEIISKFKRQRKIVDSLMLLALPSAMFGILLFALFAAVLSFSTLALLGFSFLALSALISYVANLYIPRTLTDVIAGLERAVREISFAVTPAIGEKPAQRILNQLARTDHYVKKVMGKNPNSAQINALVKGRSGKDHLFDVYIHNVNSLGRFFGDKTDINIFVKRFDDVDPISVEVVRNLREEVRDSLLRMGRRVPTRVLAISASGFDDPVFEYVRSKEGSFSVKYLPVLCRIELVKEKVDGNYDVLSF